MRFKRIQPLKTKHFCYISTKEWRGVRLEGGKVSPNLNNYGIEVREKPCKTRHKNVRKYSNPKFGHSSSLILL